VNDVRVAETFHLIPNLSSKVCLDGPMEDEAQLQWNR
jgi:hypothetical protein